MESKSVQIGGDHYKGFVYEPFEIAHANHYDGECLSILKYVMRHEMKAGAVDLRKAMHIVDIRADLIEKHGDSPIGRDTIPPSEFIPANSIKAPEAMVLTNLHSWALQGAPFPDRETATFIKGQIADLITIYYPGETQ